MINPLLKPTPEFPLQAHSSLEIRPSFRLIPRWTRLVLAAGLQQQYRIARIGGQAVGEQATRSAGADDDVVECFHGFHRTPLPLLFGSKREDLATPAAASSYSVGESVVQIRITGKRADYACKKW